MASHQSVCTKYGRFREADTRELGYYSNKFLFEQSSNDMKLLENNE